MAQYAHLSTPDPEFLDLISKMPTPSDAPAAYTIESLRAQILKVIIPQAQAYHGPRLPSDTAYTVENHTVAVDGGEISVRCIQPTPVDGESDGFPILCWFHGGGWCFGTLDDDDFHLRALAVDLRISIVNVDYRLAPEQPFPTGLDDCYTALKWTISNAPKFRGSPVKGLIVGGASAGANLAAVLALRARDDPLFGPHKVTGQLLEIPALFYFKDYPDKYKSELLSIEQNKDAFGLTKGVLEYLADCLKAPPGHPDFSPLLHPSHANLPPAYIMVAGLDPLRDEGLLYERVLREAGVATRLNVYPGLPHPFHLMFPQMAASVKCEAEFRAGLRWLLRHSGA
ncbi:Alpha/Beta hydrolase protein [Mycena rebaudengoi]|nr:Alpha/Beta hydrolase protein [Mycena rebaudengoi]